MSGCSTRVWRCPVFARGESTTELPHWKVKVRKKALRKRSISKKKSAVKQKKADVATPAELPSDALRWRGEPWKQHRLELRRLQFEIYSSSLEGAEEAVEKLQVMLLTSDAAKSLAVRRVAMTHPQRRLPGPDGVHSLDASSQRSLKDVLSIDGRSDAFGYLEVPRAWCDLREMELSKPEVPERIAVCSMMDRAKQVLLSWALEPQFEGWFSEVGAMQHRPGRSIHDFLDWLKEKLGGRSKHVMIVRLTVKSVDRVDDYLKTRVSKKAGDQLGSWLEAGLLEMGLSPVGIGRHGEEFSCPILPLVSNLLSGQMIQSILEITDTDEEIAAAAWNGSLIFVSPSASTLTRAVDHLFPTAEGIGLEVHREISARSADENWIPFFEFRLRQRPSPVGDAYLPLIEPREGVLERHLENLNSAFRLSRIFHEDKSGLINRCNPMIRSFSDHFCTIDAADELEEADERLKELLIDWSIREYSLLSPEEAVEKAFGGTQDADLGFEFKTRIVSLVRHGDAMRKFRPSTVDCDRSPYDGDRVYWKGRLQQFEHGLYPSLA